jgi:hypothetical protein
MAGEWSVRLWRGYGFCLLVDHWESGRLLGVFCTVCHVPGGARKVGRARSERVPKETLYVGSGTIRGGRMASRQG